ncbi:hypothetical protein PSEUDO8Z_160107 [Pseudomonas sp. 8Z]|nr:hypothetical protein PSEUDO8Z_160107 [Pseudomonas sp. 8Z]
MGFVSLEQKWCVTMRRAPALSEWPYCGQAVASTVDSTFCSLASAAAFIAVTWAVYKQTLAGAYAERIQT